MQKPHKKSAPKRRLLPKKSKALFGGFAESRPRTACRRGLKKPIHALPRAAGCPYAENSQNFRLLLSNALL